jgi:hypothetical protein
MDTSHYPSFQRLARVSVQLAGIQHRAAQAENNTPDHDEQLLLAVAASDWPAVSALSEQLAACSSDPADERLVRVAQKTGAALRRSPNSPKAKRQIRELMVECREAKIRRAS